MTVECPPNPYCRVYHVRQNMGLTAHWARSLHGTNEPEGILSLIAEIAGVSDIYCGGYEITVCRAQSFTDDEVFGPVEALIRDMEGEPK